MKNLIFCLLISLPVFKGIAQVNKDVKVKPYSLYNLDYIDPNPWEDFRVHKAGTKAVAVMALVPIDLPSILDAGDTTDNDLINRLPEYIFPNIRIYRSERVVTTFGLVFAQTSSKAQGTYAPNFTNISTGEVWDNGGLESITTRTKKRKIALRAANDWHFKPLRFKRFDLDPYWGVSGSFGYAPLLNVSEVSFTNGDYNNIRESQRYLSFGLDGYFGCNVMFERFSLGLELIAFGGDFQRGAGLTKVELEQSFGGTTTSQEYYESDDANLTGYFSELKKSENQISMYKGIRGIFCFYFD
ncbi:MAG: hypothetical protein RL040_488 [Bacteroidota bacterium]|jgi:hypothetical protein